MMPIRPSPQTHTMYQRKPNFHFLPMAELVFSGGGGGGTALSPDTLSAPPGRNPSTVRLPTHTGSNSLTYARNLK